MSSGLGNPHLRSVQPLQLLRWTPTHSQDLPILDLKDLCRALLYRQALRHSLKLSRHSFLNPIYTADLISDTLHSPRKEQNSIDWKNKEIQRVYRMDVMELVENEPNARPFQCDWQTCNKVSISKELHKTAVTDEACRASTESLIYSVIIVFIRMRGLTHA